MTDLDRRIIETFCRALTSLSEIDKEKLLAFGEGVAIMAERTRGEAERGGA